jgi:hypothetical protein
VKGKSWIFGLLVAAVALAGLGACRGPAGPALIGTWSGFVYLYDEFGAPLANDSNITVIALPTANQEITGDAGSYAFTTLSTGVYSLQYLGTGFGTYEMANVEFVGGGTVNIPAVRLSKASVGIITNLALTANAAGDTVFATGTITAPPSGVARYVRLFYSNANTVGSNPTLWTVTGPIAGKPYAVTSAAFSIVITGQDLQALRNSFPAGTAVYAIAYGESYYENSYTDPNTGHPIFPNVCSVPSNVVTFTMP